MWYLLIPSRLLTIKEIYMFSVNFFTIKFQTKPAPELWNAVGSNMPEDGWQCVLYPVTRAKLLKNHLRAWQQFWKKLSSPGRGTGHGCPWFKNRSWSRRALSENHLENLRKLYLLFMSLERQVWRCQTSPNGHLYPTHKHDLSGRLWHCRQW